MICIKIVTTVLELDSGVEWSEVKWSGMEWSGMKCKELRPIK